MDIVISEEKGVRFLHFGSNWVQGAMRIARPYALELEYTREMMAPLLIRPESTWPKSALFIGLGVGALPKFLHKHRPSCRITVVEIASSVHRAAQMHFKLPEPSPYFQVEIACGADYMSQTQRTFDLIVVDTKGKTRLLDVKSVSYRKSQSYNCKPGDTINRSISKKQKSLGVEIYYVDGN